MRKQKSKVDKIKVKKKKNENDQKQKLANIEFQKTIQTIEYRKQETGIKRETTNAERQKEFERKQQEDGLRKVAFWLSNNTINLIENEQKVHLKKHKIKLNKSKILTKLLKQKSSN